MLRLESRFFCLALLFSQSTNQNPSFYTCAVSQNQIVGVEPTTSGSGGRIFSEGKIAINTVVAGTTDLTLLYRNRIHSPPYE